MIVHGNRQNALGLALADHIIVEDAADFLGRGNPAVLLADQRRLGFLADDVVAKLHALIANEHGGAGYELPDLVLRFAAKGTVEGAF